MSKNRGAFFLTSFKSVREPGYTGIFKAPAAVCAIEYSHAAGKCSHYSCRNETSREYRFSSPRPLQYGFAQAFSLKIPDTDVLIRGADIPGSSWCIQMLPLLSKGATTTLFAYAEQ